MSYEYNYLEAVKDDVRSFLEDDWSFDVSEVLEDREGLEERLNEACWIADSVTGNASGSYTFSTYAAEENICHNLDLLAEACSDFGSDMGEIVKQGAEACDVTIRCYVLTEAISDVLDEVEEYLANEEKVI